MKLKSFYEVREREAVHNKTDNKNDNRNNYTKQN